MMPSGSVYDPAPLPRGHVEYSVRPVDLITCLYLLVNACLVLCWASRIESAYGYCAAFSSAAVAVMVIPPLCRCSTVPWVAFIGELYPIAGFTFQYMSTAVLNQASPLPWFDPWLAEIDRSLFGGLVCDRFSTAIPHPLFAESMAFFYFSYYLLIPSVSLILWFKNRGLCLDCIFSMACSFYLFYLIFSLFPSAGPQFYARQGAIEWKGFFFGPLLTSLLENTELPTGSFPSSHVGIALAITFFAWRFHRGLGVITAFLTSGLCFAILYGGPHYALDLPCGLVAGSVFLGLSRLISRTMKNVCRQKNHIP
ncbi:MAG: phosphatase PAP2 family protein [Planctomycetota bacterium]